MSGELIVREIARGDYEAWLPLWDGYNTFYGRSGPTALDPVDFALAGPAEWRGGVAKAPGNGILATTLPVECGVNRVILRSTPVAGKIALVAKSGSLKPATLALESKPVAITDGLMR